MGKRIVLSSPQHLKPSGSHNTIQRLSHRADNRMLRQTKAFPNR
ncbi:Uncharacterised protein [Vibrio cholerae]|nr:Uncharacterised protein [Vibrio cholerae]